MKEYFFVLNFKPFDVNNDDYLFTLHFTLLTIHLIGSELKPERIEPPPDGTYDIRSDIWSMGITLIEIATGQFPYKNWNTDFEILSKVIQEASPKLPEDGQFSDNFRNFIDAW